MKKSNTKKMILEKATDLFYRYGFVKASIRDIVREVKVTNSTVYIHFKNKDEILFSVIKNIGSVLLEELNKIIEMHDDPVECLREMIFRQVCLIKEKRKEIKIYIEEQYQLPTTLRNKALKQHRQIYDLYYNKISEITDKGLVYDIDKTVMTFGIFAIMNWSYRWFKDNGRLSIEEIAQDIVRISFRGIFKEDFLPHEYKLE
ncbi:MAG: TetR/AcrR family transcriptional regulator [Thermodesulfobacteriota bacterium]|nr:TetR/AcrR family transcriptional regulator [Thermodesulfobacteriota bacterium]